MLSWCYCPSLWKADSMTTPFAKVPFSSASYGKNVGEHWHVSTGDGIIQRQSRESLLDMTPMGRLEKRLVSANAWMGVSG
ncbi:hypothetical protein Nepgr_023171 [Nepenthes gracilis]|uniref:Uncharacterized protein n=1 Tax=Nepenthes gracilis TaxID=150966 RepID=A0AAD3XYS7_NEPGR|nr:hypothetical protein Nepgr_023171 [Nepenthes gracilis]